MKVAAVVVTYNRKELVKECLQALLAQTRPPDEIILIDNASSDGTDKMVPQEFPQVTYVRLPKNIGGAGGFHEGIKLAYQKGYDWIWVMDDDGVPSRECLSALLEVKDDQLRMRAPLVLRKGDKERRLAFGLTFNGRHIRTEAEAYEVASNAAVLEGVANPFNGLLINRAVVAKIGLPMKEFFLWGDETEYLLRAVRHSVKFGTVLKAVFFHPENRMTPRRVKIGGLSFSVYHTKDDFRNFLILRNGAYIAARYYGITAIAKHVAKYLLFYSTEYGLRGGLWSLRSSWRGIRGNFGSPPPTLWRGNPDDI